MIKEEMTNEEATNTLKDLKSYYNDKNEDSYVGFDNEDNEAIDLAIKALEKMDKIKNIFKDCGVRPITREQLNEDFEDFSIGDIKDEMWDLYIILYKIDCVLKDKAESEVNADE